ncbi:MAG: zinc-binding dehydrogenase [Leptolyngbya sp. SIO1D8]|nr:zinc-binding dehydrogenase [Leptolyngbya sp. SIO1D8]
MDDQGTELLEIEEYALRRVSLERADATIAKQSGIQNKGVRPDSKSENFHLHIASSGILDTLTFRPDTRQKPSLGEVEIEVSATGLNFKEVLFALGLIPASSNFKLGLECAGKIVAMGKDVEGFEVGDEVIAFGSSCFSRFITTPAKLVASKPENLSLQEAATVPIAFTTAYYALIKMGQLRQGEKVLIHAATGGVGMAAVQIAKWVGAQIFATAGNPEKRQFLHSLGIENVMDSRSVAFADEVMKHTNGKGVDVVLNSLSGEFIPKGLSVLARYGRFLELGLRDILSHSQLDLSVFEKRLSFFAIQADLELPNFSSLWHEVVLHFQEGNFAPLPHRVFPVTEIVDAFKYMAEAKHIGKIVVSLEDKGITEKLLFADSLVRHGVEKNLAASTVSPYEPSTVSLADSNWIKELATSSNIPQIDFLKDGLSPSEGIEAFKRILGSKLSQTLVSTTDLLGGIKPKNGNHVANYLETIDKPSSSLSTPSVHSRPELNNAYIPPRNEIEKGLTDIWQDVLGINQIGISDNFFELGGDSLLIVQVRSKLQEMFKRDFSTTDLFQYPTISDLTKYIGQEQVEQPTFQKAHDRAKRQQEAMEEEIQLIRQRRKERG